MSKKQKDDRHGAAKSGSESELRLRAIVKKHGFQLLRIQKDFDEAGLKILGRNKFKKPEWWPEQCKKTRKKGNESFFNADGFLNVGDGIIIELKNSNKHGTTDEKVIYDLEKIRDGVYGKDHKLIYAFVGKVCQDIGPYRLFELKAKMEDLPVQTVFGWDELEKVIESLKDGAL
mgnify:CR=1 FL=1